MFILFLLGGLTLAFAGLAVYARAKHESLKQASSQLIFKLTMEGSALEKDLLGKIYALENGGHLATGTTQALVNAQLPTPGGTNGSQPPATVVATS